MDIMEEGAKRSLQISKIILVHWWMHPDNRQVFVVQGVAPDDVDLMTERRPLQGFLEHEPSRNMEERIDRPIHHGFVGVFLSAR